MPSELIVDETPLTEPFIPERLPHREGVMKEIVSALRPAAKNRSAENLLIYGESGTGKTTVIKYILKNELKDSAVYINCWNIRTRHKILSEILLKMNQIAHGRDGTDELAKRFEQLVKRRIVVCLDEADQLSDLAVLYNLARSNTAVVLIANNEFLLATADPRISSSLWLNRVHFKNYSASELFDILKERAAYSLKPDTVGNEVLRIISHIAGGDACIALQTLRNTARIAERRNLERITVEETRKAVKDARLSKRAYFIAKLGLHERKLFDILEKTGKTKSGKLYGEYCKVVEYPLQDRAYRANMEKLVERGLVIALGEGKGRSYEIVGESA